MNIITPKNFNTAITETMRHLKFPDIEASEGIMAQVDSTDKHYIAEITIIAADSTSHPCYTFYFDEIKNAGWWKGHESTLYTPVGVQEATTMTQEIAIEEPADVEPIKPKRRRKASQEDQSSVNPIILDGDIKAEGTE